ncbi:MAG: molecular chaperone HtpG [Acholeplasmatales bacterium]|nr:molecular chaperone HtpG [Acholeplasmatales bacterium]
MSEKFEFKTETKRLLDMMINSIYTHKEIFLRELISNASDAIDKRHFLSLTNDKVKDLDYEIKVEADKALRTLTITDNGIGFTHEDLVNNLGTIARSGSKEFVEKMNKENQGKDDVDIIGQFGVGFYSGFMVADLIEVITKSPLEEKGYKFISEGLESYSIDEVSDASEGTKIILHLRANTDDVKYDEYLDEYTIKDLVRKYSDYIRYPIKTWVTKYETSDEKDEKGNPKSVETSVLETINSMTPIWRKEKKDVTDEMLNTFYKQKFMDWQDPLLTIQSNVEGNVTYRTLMFIPRQAPYDLYQSSYEKGLQLYTKGVFVIDKCKELLPDYLKFVKGLVDTEDLPLNISREMLQEDRSLTLIAKSVESKILSELKKTLEKDRAKYEEFFASYGVNLKYGVYENFGEKKEKLQDLLLFESLNSDKKITLREYKDAMKEGQKSIYFASAKDKASALMLPQIEAIKEKGFDVLVLTDHVDEFMLQVLKEYDKVEFKNIAQANDDLLTEDEKKELDKKKEENKDFLADLKNDLPEVKEVVISSTLTTSPCCLSSGNGISFEMEKVLNAQQDSDGKIRADRILEINPNHELVKLVEERYKENKDSIKDYAKLLYDAALIDQGMPLTDPKEFNTLLVNLMTASLKK